MFRNKILFLLFFYCCLAIFNLSWAVVVSLEQENGMKFASQGMFNEARSEFIKALTKNKSDSTSQSALGLLDDFKASKINKQCLLGLFKGLVLLNENQKELAIDEFKSAGRLNPGYSKIHNILGVAYTAIGEVKEAEAEFKKAIELEPSYSQAYFNLALLYQTQNHVQGALISYEKALKFNSNLFEACMNSGYIYAETGQYSQATTFFLKAIKIDSQSPDAYFNLGMAYFMTDQYLRSRGNFLKAKDLFLLKKDQTGIEKTDKFLNKFFELEGKWRAAK